MEEVLLAVSLDDYLVNISESFEFYPDPRYDTFQEPNGVKQVSSNDTLRITVSVWYFMTYPKLILTLSIALAVSKTKH